MKASEVRAVKERAQTAADRGDWREALAAWLICLDNFPEELAGYLGAAAAYRHLRDHEQADHTIARAVERFPSAARPLVEYAHAASARGDFEVALPRWQAAVSRFPDRPWPWVGLASALRELRRLDEAEIAALKAIETFPDFIHGFVEYARVSMACNDFEESDRRWSSVRQRFPDHPAGYTGGSWPLRRLARLDEADSLLSEAIRVFPGEAQPSIDYAGVAEDRRDWPEAIRRWSKAVEDYPNAPSAYAGLSKAYAMTGQLDRAETCVRSAIERFPRDEACLAQYARTAMARGDFSEAILRWNSVLELYPNSRFARTGLGEAKIVELLNSAAAQDSREVNNSDGQVHGDQSRNENASTGAVNFSTEQQTTGSSLDRRSISDRELMYCFEGLGDNCEFGLVQRHFQAEPLSLLRFAYISPANLVRALDDEFQGVGEIANTSLVSEQPDGSGELFCDDLRYGLHMHTFVQAGSVDHNVALQQFCRRLRFLRNKLSSDLRAAEKVFVYKRATQDLGDNDIWRLACAIRRYAPNKLLFLRRSSQQHAPGTVDLIEPGICIGYVDLFTVRVESISYVTWLPILRRANELLHS